MYKINGIILFFTLIVIHVGCGQSNKNNSEIPKTLEIMNNLKRFNKESVYKLSVETPYNYEIRVNDIVVARRFFNQDGFSIINQAIFKSGKQELKIKVLPQSISRTKDKEYLEQDAPFYVKIKETAWEDGNFVESKVVFEFELPEEDAIGNEIDYSKKKNFNTKAVFKAEVPYTLESWQDSKVFTSEDIENITPKVLAFYKKIKSNYDNQQGEKYVNQLEKGIFNESQAVYFDSTEAKKNYSFTINYINEEPRSIDVIENYTLELMGNGRLLALVRTDGYNKGTGVLREHYIESGISKRVRNYQIFLHMPKGSDEFEVIWCSGTYW